MSTTITADIDFCEIRQLSDDEMEDIQGGFWANVAGAAVGGVAGGVSSYFASGGNWKSAAAGALGGAAAGALNPVGAIGSAAAAVGRGVVSGVVAGGANRVMGNQNPGPNPGGG